MTKEEIINKVKTLKLPQGSYIVFGSCPLAIAGIREAGDIDMLVDNDVLEELRKLGWKQETKGPNDTPLVFEDFEAHNSWNFSLYCPTLEHLLENANIVDGIPFASLDEVRKWKVASGRPKDFKDIELIDTYLSSQIVS